MEKGIGSSLLLLASDTRRFLKPSLSLRHHSTKTRSSLFMVDQRRLLLERVISLYRLHCVLGSHHKQLKSFHGWMPCFQSWQLLETARSPCLLSSFVPRGTHRSHTLSLSMAFVSFSPPMAVAASARRRGGVSESSLVTPGQHVRPFPCGKKNGPETLDFLGI